MQKCCLQNIQGFRTQKCIHLSKQFMEWSCTASAAFISKQGGCCVVLPQYVGLSRMSADPVATLAHFWIWGCSSCNIDELPCAGILENRATVTDAMNTVSMNDLIALWSRKQPTKECKPAGIHNWVMVSLVCFNNFPPCTLQSSPSVHLAIERNKVGRIRPHELPKIHELPGCWINRWSTHWDQRA